jgi:hypothetical protein
MFICFLSLFVLIQVSGAYVKVLSIIVFFSLSFNPILPLNLHERGFKHWDDFAFAVSSIFMNVVIV